MDVLSVKQEYLLKRGEVTKTIHERALEGKLNAKYNATKMQKVWNSETPALIPAK